MVRVTRLGNVTRFDLARTLAGRGRYWTTAYLVDGLLIDSGCAHTAPEFIRALEGLAVDRIVHTHSHEDHIGADGAVRRRYGPIPVAAHHLAVEVLADPRGLQPLHPYRKVMWGWPEPVPATPLAEGDEIRTPNFRFQVLATPGHSPDHICFFEPDQGWLFTGDLYVGGRDRALRVDSDANLLLDSLRRIEALPISTLYPGAARIPDDARAALRDKILWLETVRDRVLALHRNGRTFRSIVREVCGPPMLIDFITLGHFARWHLVRSFLSRAIASDSGDSG
jgi:glyoxylase-like metal-dependent hydrolase (beta-lactamase superfamily II)